MLNRLREWVERFTADEPTPEEIMEIRAREGTLLDLREAKEGFPHELTEADEDDYVHACYDNEGLDEIEAFDREALEEMERRIREEEDDILTNPAYNTVPGNIFYHFHHKD